MVGAHHQPAPGRNPKVDPSAGGRSRQYRVGIQLVGGTNVVPEGLTNKTSFRQWSLLYKCLAGPEDDRFETLLGLAAAREPTATTGAPEASSLPGAERFGKHVHAILLLSTVSGTEVHPIVDNMLGENGFEAWGLFVQWFDPASAHSNLNITRTTFIPPTGKFENISFLIDTWDDLVRRQDEQDRKRLNG